MSRPLYMDAHIDGAITSALRNRGLDILTAQQDGADAWSDDDLLDRAAWLGRVFITYDRDFLAMAAARQAQGIEFAGNVYVRILGASTATILGELELIARTLTADEIRNSVQYVPM